MTRYRAPTPHASPPMSKHGERLTRSLGGDVTWNYRDAYGVVHGSKPQQTASFLGVTSCKLDHQITDDSKTLAAVTCLWCAAGSSWWSGRAIP